MGVESSEGFKFEGVTLSVPRQCCEKVLVFFFLSLFFVFVILQNTTCVGKKKKTAFFLFIYFLHQIGLRVAFDLRSDTDVITHCP